MLCGILLLLGLGLLQEVPIDGQILVPPCDASAESQSLSELTYLMKLSSSGLWALMGGAASFCAFDPPIAKNVPEPMVARVIIASFIRRY